MISTFLISFFLFSYNSYANEDFFGDFDELGDWSEEVLETGEDFQSIDGTLSQTEPQGFYYDPFGKRDPFAKPEEERPIEQGAFHGPVLPLQRHNIEEMRLAGILWNVHNPRALVATPGGETHLVQNNTRIGRRNGYVAEIREGEIIIVETVERDGRLLTSSHVMRIAR